MEQIQKAAPQRAHLAPEAGTQRLRDAINKNVTEDEVMRTVRSAFMADGRRSSFILCLPFPLKRLTMWQASPGSLQRVVDAYYQNPNKPKGKGAGEHQRRFLRAKALYAFQWEPQGYD